jgi:hypothetical protein
LIHNEKEEIEALNNELEHKSQKVNELEVEKSKSEAEYRSELLSANQISVFFSFLIIIFSISFWNIF